MRFSAFPQEYSSFLQVQCCHGEWCVKIWNWQAAYFQCFNSQLMLTKQREALFSAGIAITLQCRTGCRVGKVGIFPYSVYICSGAWISLKAVRYKQVSTVRYLSKAFLELTLDEIIKWGKLENWSLYLTPSKRRVFGIGKPRVWFINCFQFTISNPDWRHNQKAVYGKRAEK